MTDEQPHGAADAPYTPTDTHEDWELRLSTFQGMQGKWDPAHEHFVTTNGHVFRPDGVEIDLSPEQRNYNADWVRDLDPTNIGQRDARPGPLEQTTPPSVALWDLYERQAVALERIANALEALRPGRGLT